jgi:hypothetical protein
MDTEGEEIQTQCMHNLFNKIITDNFLNLKKVRIIEVLGA